MKNMSKILFLVLLGILSACGKSEKEEELSLVKVVEKENILEIYSNKDLSAVEILLDGRVGEGIVIVPENNLAIVKSEEIKTRVSIAKKNSLIKAGDLLFTVESERIAINVSDYIEMENSENVKAYTEEEALLGDIDENGEVNLLDFNIFKNSYKSSLGEDGYIEMADIAPAKKGNSENFKNIYSFVDRDGKIELLDFVIFAANFGKTLPQEVKILYIDSLNGNDENSGTELAPLKTVARLFEVLKGGETVIFKEGEYEGFAYSSGDKKNIFESEVTFIAEEGADVKVGKLSIINWQYTYELNLKIDGINLIDGIKFTNGSGLKVYNCKVENLGDLVGSEENMAKVGIGFENVKDIEIVNSEIVNCATGIDGGGRNILIKGNEIHDCSHDGIRMVGMIDSLIEGNKIYHLDDGVWDDEADWSKHCDALHMFIKGGDSADVLIPNENVTLRGNIVYGLEAQGIQFNTYYKFPEIKNKNIILENNIFGPSVSNNFNAISAFDGLTVRNNSFIAIEGGYTFQSKYREITCNNNTFRLTDDFHGAYIYNNVFQNYNGDASADSIELFRNNIIERTDININCDLRFNHMIDESVFLNPENLDGKIKPESIAVNGGTEIYANFPSYEYAINGVMRDIRPDIGAYEIEGTNPEEEEEVIIYNDEKFIFIDDFEDGDFKKDDWLNGVNTEGIEWINTGISYMDYYINSQNHLDGNAINGPVNTEANLAMIVAEGGLDWNNYTFSFIAEHAYITDGDGVVFLYRDNKNYLFLDVANESGNLIVNYEDENGLEQRETLFSDELLRIGHGAVKPYTILVNNSGESIELGFDIDNDEIYDLTYLIEDDYLVSKFVSGTVGFYKENQNMYTKNIYDDVKVELLDY